MGFFLRILPYSKVFQSGQVFLFAQDPHYHLRRLLIALSHQGNLPVYDSYSGFPDGLYCFWSNLYEYSILWAYYILHYFKGTIQLETLVAFSPVVWGILTLIPFYLLMKVVFEHRVALLSVFLCCLLPGHIYQTLLGRADHYGCDGFFPMYMFYFFIRGLRVEDSHKSLAYGLLCGICITLSWLTWPGSTIFFGILLVCMGGVLYQSSQEHSLARLYPLFFMILLSCFISLYPVGAGSYFGRQGQIRYDAISWFQLIFMGASIILLSFIWIYQKTAADTPQHLRPVKIILITITLLLIGLITISPSIHQSLTAGLGWVFKTDPWLTTITEFQPLFISMGVFSDFRALAYFGYMAYLAPVVLLFFIVKWYREEGITTSRMIFIIFSICFLFLGYNQSRFSHFMAFPVSGLMAIGLYYWAKQIILGKYLESRYKGILSLLIIFLGTYYCLRPCFAEIRALPDKYAVIPQEWKETLDWIRNSTPATSYLYSPWNQPEYGILAPWITGHWINYYARRPALANGFHTNSDNNKKTMEFFLTEDIREGKAILNQKNIRYVILTDMTPNLQDYARILGQNSRSIVFKTVVNNPQGGTGISFEPTQGYYRLISTRLYLNDGAGLVFASRGCLRLVYEYPGFWDVDNEKISMIKIYEYLPGARLLITGTPYSTVQIGLPIQTNARRKFNYQVSVTLPASGSTIIYLPYSQTGNDYETKATGSYEIKSGTQKLTLSIDEKSVLIGKNYELHF